MSEIKEANIEFKKQLSVKWIKAASGHTYLCPVDALNRFDNPTEEQLKTIRSWARTRALPATSPVAVEM